MIDPRDFGRPSQFWSGIGGLQDHAFDELVDLDLGEAAGGAVDGFDEGAVDGDKLFAEEPQFEADEVEFPEHGLERHGVVLAEIGDGAVVGAEV